MPRYNKILDGYYFTPTIEPEHDGAVLTEKMFGLLESGKFNKVPIMMGFTTLEWGFLKYGMGDLLRCSLILIKY